MTDREGLTAVDLIAAFIGRRVLPLQRRPHRICDMSGWRDPCRLSTKELTAEEIAVRVNDISAAGLKVKEWRFGKEKKDFYHFLAESSSCSFGKGPAVRVTGTAAPHSDMTLADAPCCLR